MSAGLSTGDGTAWLAALGPGAYHDDNSIPDGSESLFALLVGEDVGADGEVEVIEDKLGGLDGEALVYQFWWS